MAQQRLGAGGAGARARARGRAPICSRARRCLDMRARLSWLGTGGAYRGARGALLQRGPRRGPRGRAGRACRAPVRRADEGAVVGKRTTASLRGETQAPDSRAGAAPWWQQATAPAVMRPAAARCTTRRWRRRLQRRMRPPPLRRWSAARLPAPAPPPGRPGPWRAAQEEASRVLLRKSGPQPTRLRAGRRTRGRGACATPSSRQTSQLRGSRGSAGPSVIGGRRGVSPACAAGRRALSGPRGGREIARSCLQAVLAGGAARVCARFECCRASAPAAVLGWTRTITHTLGTRGRWGRAAAPRLREASQQPKTCPWAPAATRSGRRACPRGRPAPSQSSCGGVQWGRAGKRKHGTSSGSGAQSPRGAGSALRRGEGTQRLLELRSSGWLLRRAQPPSP